MGIKISLISFANEIAAFLWKIPYLVKNIPKTIKNKYGISLGINPPNKSP
jgi:hypothetical protein